MDSPTPVGDVDLLLLNGTLLTMSDPLLIEDGAIAIKDGRIVEIASTGSLSSAYPSATRLDARGGVVHPGFVDAHVHLTHHLGRSTIPDEWPEEDEALQVFPYWKAMEPDDSYVASLVACLEMVKNGTTTFSDMSGRDAAELRQAAASEVGMRGAISELCWDIPPDPALAMGTTEECLEVLEALVARMPRSADGRTWGAVNLSGMGKASDALLAGAKHIARDNGLTMAIHQSFAPADVDAYRAEKGVTAVEHLESLEILGPDLTLVHMNHCEPREVEILAATRTNVVHCPGASVKAGVGASKVGRFPEMLGAGVNVALGSDSGNYADSFDVSRQAYLAATIHREARQHRPIISSIQALQMATTNGARALGIADEVGRLAVGMRADIVIHEADDVLWSPFLNVPNLLVYSAQSRTVDTVLINGEVVLKDGRSPRVDEAEIVHRAKECARRIYERMDWAAGPAWWEPRPGTT
jgi:cytosine/adenosine deaminase-related metal-dependent hydrolase